MDNDSYIISELEILIIIKEIVSYIIRIIQKRITCEELEKELNIYYYKLNRDEQSIKRLFPRGYGRYSFINHYAYDTKVPPRLSNLLTSQSVIESKIRQTARKVNKANEEYEIELNLLDSYLEKYDEEILNAVTNYLDIDINLENKYIKKSVLIRDCIINDFEILVKNSMYFSNFELYRGTVSIVKLILEQKDICELKIKMYKQLKEKNKNLSDKRGELFDLIQQRKQKINELESALINKIFKHDELKKLKISLEELNKIWDDLLLEIDINKYETEQFLEDNCQIFNNYI